MKNDDLLKKITNNKYFLFIIPNLIYMYRLLSLYIGNRDVEVLYYEVVILSLFFLIISFLISKILHKMLKNNQKVFLVMCLISVLYLVRYSIIGFLMTIVFILLVIIDIKKFFVFSLDNIIGIISMIIILLFGYSFIVSSYKAVGNMLLTKKYDNKFDIKVDSIKEKPNIYYIHCDAMMNFSDIKKYYNNDIYKFKNYLNSHNYLVNDNASFIAGHRTSTSLVALFNPYYYDSFYRKYLLNLEDIYLRKNTNVSFKVSFNDLEERRLNNELLNSLELVGYKTIGIGEYNQYTSINTSKFYDYYFYDYWMKHIVSGKDEFRDIIDNNTLKKRTYIRLVHAKSLIYKTMLGNIIKDVNYLKYRSIDYNNLDFSNYQYINKTSYWPSKAIIKGISMELNKDKKFFFIDYNLNHYPITYDYNGNLLEKDKVYNINYYIQNYIYSIDILMDIIKYIEYNDKNGIIIIQSDHGIHTFNDKDMMNFFNIGIEEVENIRNSTISAIYIPDKYKNNDIKYLNNPLNISRFLVNSYVGKNYEYLE